MLNLKDIPVESTVDVLDPNGDVIITTNNPTTLTYIRLEIKKNHLKGYSVRKHNGEVEPILPNGKITNWCGITGEVMDNLLLELI